MTPPNPPPTIAEYRRWALDNPLPTTVQADVAIAQIVLGRSTVNDPGMRAGMFLELRRRVAEARKT